MDEQDCSVSFDQKLPDLATGQMLSDVSSKLARMLGRSTGRLPSKHYSWPMTDRRV